MSTAHPPSGRPPRRGRRLIIAGALVLLVGASVTLSQTLGSEPGDRSKRATRAPQDGPSAGIAQGVPGGPAAGELLTPSNVPPAATEPSIPPGRTTTGGPNDQVPVTQRPTVRCASKGAPKTGSLPSADDQAGLRWVTATRLTGNCDGSSSPFRLRGIDTRLVWRSDADSFTVFVVDVTQGREGSAGFSDAQCAAACSESQAVVPAAGDYTLEVQAGDGPWEVEIQEYRRP